MTIADKLREALDGREFYELMQAYRLAPVMPQHEVTECFEAVKSYVVGFVAFTENENDSSR